MSIPNITKLHHIANPPRPARRNYRKIEIALQNEILIRARRWYPQIIFVPIPNSFFIPARTVSEKALAARLVHQMKERGLLFPGAWDMIATWGLPVPGFVGLEIKRPAINLLLEKIPPGTLSDNQKRFRDDCERGHQPYEVVHSWEETVTALEKHGAPIPRDEIGKNGAGAGQGEAPAPK